MKQKLIKLSSFRFLIFILPIHLLILCFTKFSDFPEMIFYPWLLKQGLILYKDISIAYPPLSVYINYIFFSITGFTVSSYRILTYSIILINDILLFTLCNWLLKDKKFVYIIMTLFVVLQVSFEGNLLWHELMYVPFMLGAYWFLCHYVLHKSVNNLIYAGILFGFAFLIKQTIFWTIFTISITIFVFHIRNIRTALSRTFIFDIIPIIFFVSLFLFTCFQNLSNQFINWVILYPLSLTHTPSAYSYLPSWKLMIQILSIYICIPMLLIPIISTKTTYSNRWFMIFCFSFCLGLTPLVFPRWNVFRLQPSLIFVIIAFGFILVNINLFQNNIWQKITLISSGLIVLILITHYQTVYFTQNNPNSIEFLGNKSIVEANKINSIIGKNSFYIWGDYDYYYILMGKKPFILPWTQHFSWVIEAMGLENTIIKKIDENYISYIILSDTSTPKLMIRYLNSMYERQDIIGKNGSIYKRRNK